MRIAFTIIYNGKHHLLHNSFSSDMIANFDYWVIVEGAAQNGGSTAWCNSHTGGVHSDDGTVEYITELAKNNKNVIIVLNNRKWKSKDEQVNAAITEVKAITNKCWLWQVDADEQWTLNAIEQNEAFMEYWDVDTGLVSFDHYVGEGLIAVGEWGSGVHKRIWKWNGQRFLSHEPPVLESEQREVVCPYGYKHYSYYFEQDVRFKAEYYKGHESVYSGWKYLKDHRDELIFPVHIKMLFGNKGIGLSKTKIIETNEKEKNQTATEKLPEPQVRFMEPVMGNNGIEA